jgi:hydrogenase maturation protease
MNSGVIDRRAGPGPHTTPRVLVIGFGNPIRGDDALGPLVAERLAEKQNTGSWPAPDVEVLVRHSLTPELASDLAAVARAVFLDAAVDGPVGAVVCRAVAPSPAGPVPDPHCSDVAGLLALTRQLYGRAPEAFLVSFRGVCFDFADRRLSPSVAAAVDAMAETARQLCAQ